MHFSTLYEMKGVKGVTVPRVVDEVCIVVCVVLLGVDVGVNVRSLRC